MYGAKNAFSFLQMAPIQLRDIDCASDVTDSSDVRSYYDPNMMAFTLPPCAVTSNDLNNFMALQQQHQKQLQLQLINAKTEGGRLGAFSDDIIPGLMAIASNAAVALDKQRILKHNEELIRASIGQETEHRVFISHSSKDRTTINERILLFSNGGTLVRLLVLKFQFETKTTPYKKGLK